MQIHVLIYAPMGEAPYPPRVFAQFEDAAEAFILRVEHELRAMGEHYALTKLSDAYMVSLEEGLRVAEVLWDDPSIEAYLTLTSVYLEGAQQ